VVTLVFLRYPLILDAASRGIYDRPVRVMDVLGGGAAHLARGALGGAVAVLFTAPRVKRRASGAAAIAAPHLLAAARARTAARC
jgi:hypothetical protein